MTKTIDAGSISLTPRSLTGPSVKYVFVNPTISKIPVTQGELLRRAWVVTGNSMRVAIRNYSENAERQKIPRPKPTIG